MSDEYRKGWDDARLAWQRQGSVPPIPPEPREPVHYGPGPEQWAKVLEEEVGEAFAPSPKPKSRKMRKRKED